MTVKIYTVDITRTVTYRTKVHATNETQALIFASAKVASAHPDEYNFQWDLVQDHQETEIVSEEEIERFL